MAGRRRVTESVRKRHLPASWGWEGACLLPALLGAWGLSFHGGKPVCLLLWPRWGGGAALFLCSSHGGKESCYVCICSLGRRVCLLFSGSHSLGSV